MLSVFHMLLEFDHLKKIVKLIDYIMTKHFLEHSVFYTLTASRFSWTFLSSVYWLMLVSPILSVSAAGRCRFCCMQWCRRRGCKRTPKSFDLSKIRAKSLKIWAKPLNIWAKFLKTRAEMVPNVVCLQKWRSTFAGKHMKSSFWRSHQKRFSWYLW